MGGDRLQLITVEKTGYNLFMGKAKCGSCHFAPVFNGTQAPLFIKSEAEVLWCAFQTGYDRCSD
jgi:cytochrome c peroxidase